MIPKILNVAGVYMKSAFLFVKYRSNIECVSKNLQLAFKNTPFVDLRNYVILMVKLRR